MPPDRKTLSLNAGRIPANVSPGVTRPAVLGPTILVPLARAAASISITSWAGICSVRQTSSLAPASQASKAAALAAAGGMNISATSNGAVRAASTAEPKTGRPRCIVPALRGLTPPTVAAP